MKKASIFAIAFSTILSFNTISADNIRNTYNLAGTTVSITAKSKSLVIYLDDQKSETVAVKISDDNGQTLMNEKISVSKKYNLNNLPTGKYTVVVTKKDAKTIQPFEVTSSEVVIAEAQKKAYFTPKIVQKGEHIMVNALVGQYTNMTVNIRNTEGKSVFEEKHYVVFNLQKAYNIGNLPKGSYTVEVVAGDEVYTQDIEK